MNALLGDLSGSFIFTDNTGDLPDGWLYLLEYKQLPKALMEGYPNPGGAFQRE